MKSLLLTSIKLGMAATVLASASILAEEKTPEPDSFWIAPRTVHEYPDGKYKKKDFLKAVMDDRVWQTAGVKPKVFKSYMSLLGKAKVGDEVRYNFTDEELTKLAAYLKNRGIKVAFEVGGVRVKGKYDGSEGGKYFREVEAPLLRERWIKLGGEIHYLTTDHMTMAAAGTHHGKTTDESKFDLKKVIKVCADTLGVMQKEFPTVEIGLTESLGYFDIKTEDGVHYTKGRADIPSFSFADWIYPLVKICKERGVSIDHYHVDYSLSAMNRDYTLANPDGTKLDKYDIPKASDVHLSRVLHCLQEARKAGLKTGFLLTGGRHAHKPLKDGSDEEAWKVIHTIFDALAASGWKFDHLVLQSWQRFPLETSIDAGPNSFMSNAHKLSVNPKLPRMFLVGEPEE